jgi:hypothetical protein
MQPQLSVKLNCGCILHLSVEFKRMRVDSTGSRSNKFGSILGCLAFKMPFFLRGKSDVQYGVCAFKSFLFFRH